MEARKMVLAVVLCIAALLLPAQAQVAYTGAAFANVSVLTDLFGINFNWWVRADVYLNIQWPNQTTTNINTSLPFNNTLLTDLLEGMGSTATRFPGGTTSTFWNVTSSMMVRLDSDVCNTMKTNSTYTAKCATYTTPNTTNIAAYPTNYLNLLSFGENMAKVGNKWIFVANLYITTPDEIIAAIETVCANGNTACPTFLELGNEYYLPNFYPTNLMPSVQDYVSRIEQVYSAVSKYFPNNIAAVGDFAGYASSTATNKDYMWNAGLIGLQGVAYDHVTAHTYSLKATNFANNPSWSYYTLMLAWPESNLAVTAIAHRARFPAGVNIWITEFNFGATAETATGFEATQLLQPAHGLNVAGWYLSMLAFPDVYTKAWFFESMRDSNYVATLANNTGYYIYTPGQIFAHLSAINQAHNTFVYLNFTNVDFIPKLSWYNSYNKNMSALQGALFYGEDKITYVIMNRVNYTIDITLSESAGFDYVSTWEYIGNQTIGDTTFKIDPSVPAPYAGPIPVNTQKNVATNGAAAAVTLSPFSLTIFEFNIAQATTTTTTAAATTTTTAGTTEAGTTATTDASSTSATTDASTSATTDASTSSATTDASTSTSSATTDASTSTSTSATTDASTSTSTSATTDASTSTSATTDASTSTSTSATTDASTSTSATTDASTSTSATTDASTTSATTASSTSASTTSSSTTGTSTTTYTVTITFSGSCSDVSNETITVIITATENALGVNVVYDGCTSSSSSKRAASANLDLTVTVPASSTVTADSIKTTVTNAAGTAGLSGASVSVTENSPSTTSSASLTAASVLFALVCALALFM